MLSGIPEMGSTFNGIRFAANVSIFFTGNCQRVNKMEVSFSTALLVINCANFRFLLIWQNDTIIHILSKTKRILLTLMQIRFYKLQLTGMDVRTFEGELPDGLPSSLLPQSMFNSNETWNRDLEKQEIVNSWSKPILFTHALLLISFLILRLSNIY